MEKIELLKKIIDDQAILINKLPHNIKRIYRKYIKKPLQLRSGQIIQKISMKTFK